MSSLAGSIIKLSYHKGVVDYDVKLDGLSFYRCQSNGESLRLFAKDGRQIVRAQEEATWRERLLLKSDVVFRKVESRMFVSIKPRLLSYSMIVKDGDQVLREDAIRMKGWMGKTHYDCGAFSLTLRWNKPAVFELHASDHWKHEDADDGSAFLCAVMCWFVAGEDMRESDTA